MKIRRKYSTPNIEEHFIDNLISLFNDSTPPLPPGQSMNPQGSTPEAGPGFENPSSADYPFGGDKPEYTNM